MYSTEPSVSVFNDTYPWVEACVWDDTAPLTTDSAFPATFMFPLPSETTCDALLDVMTPPWAVADTLDDWEAS